MKRIYSFSKAALFVAAVLFSNLSNAQAIEKYVSFGGSSNWPISFYVPASYNPANKYKLIVGLHGLGSKSSTMRNRLQMYVTDPSSPVYNAIVVCPDNGNGAGAQTDFWTAPCDTSIITIAMNMAMSMYTIDPAYIYLNGISLGGRAALRYGLINYWRFRGIELWCPAIVSIPEANNRDASFIYPWQNGKYIPISITVGSEDGYSQNGQIDAAMKQLTALGAPANAQVEMGLPHGAPDSPYIYASYKFIDKYASSYTTNDACISTTPTPFDEECSTSFTPVVTIQNKGTNNLTSATINYQIDGGTVNTQAWSGTLKRLETQNVTLPAQTVSGGAHTFKAFTTNPNGATDGTPSNDSYTRNVYVLPNTFNPLNEGFEGNVFPPVGWSQAGTDKARWWQRLNGPRVMVDANSNPFSTTIKGGAAQTPSCIMFDNYSDSTSVGRKFSIRTAKYDFTNATANPTLSYEYAYIPISDASGVYYDALYIYYSTNCGSSWTLLKGGPMQSSTAAASTPVYFYPTSGSDWKTVTIPLAGTGVIGQSKVMFSFEDQPVWSNILYLDNINLTGVTGLSKETEANNSPVIYPNPSTGIFNVQWLANGNTSTIEVKNVLGQIMYSEKLNGLSGDITKNLDMSSFGKGVYFISLKTADSETVKKVIVY